MKKIVALLLLFAMTSTFIACGNDDINGESQTSEHSSEADTSTTDTSTTDTSAADTSTEDTSATDDEKASLGSTTTSVYESSFIGIGWTLLDEWLFATEEQMDQINALVLEIINEDTELVLPEGSTVCDMYAYDIYGSNVNIQLEKLNAVNAILITEESYGKLSLDLIKDSYTSLGYTDTNVSSTTVKIGDAEHSGIVSSCVYQGVTVYQKMAFIKQGSYMCVITASSANEEVIDSIFASFYTIK